MKKTPPHRTQIYLEEEQYQYLVREAGKSGSIAGAVRKLIDEKLSISSAGDDSLFRLGAKSFKSETGDLSQKHDDYLYPRKR